MTKSIFSTLLVLAASVMIATAVTPDGTGGKPTPPNGSVRDFSTGADGNWSTGEIKVTLATPGVLRVWDGYCFGDRYRVTVDNAVVGTTSEGSPAGGHCNSLSAAPSAEIAWNNKDFSRGEYALPAGDHTLKFTATTHPWGGPAYYSITEVSQRCAKPAPYY